MAELLLELFCEEIPARMQARAAEDLVRLFSDSCAALLEAPPKSFYGPRRIGLTAPLKPSVTTEAKEERGPRIGAPDQAIEGFLRKHGATRDALTEQGQFWVLVKPGQSVEARALVAAAIPTLIRAFPWPKSMRWGGTSSMVWVRPLKRILCVLDGEVVPFTLAQGGDDGHGLASGDLTEGHRIMSPGAFAAHSFADYKAGLAARHVVLEAEDRARMIRDGINALATAEGLEVVPDEALITEVAGLVEWPLPLLGRIDDAFMDLPPEVMRTTMRVNQRYFALRKPDGTAAPRFALVANIAAPDGGAAIVAGNERVLRARLADARFFWDLDRKQKLESFLPKLDSVVFHAKLGTQGQRVARLESLAGLIAEKLGAEAALARRAARLAKADLASGMVGEFPELQGVMGRYYALGQGGNARVAEAIAAHYRPAGAGDAVPEEPIAIAVALADKLDQLVGFFAVGEKPTGSGDPFALRRAALGAIRIILENGLELDLGEVIGMALQQYVAQEYRRATGREWSDDDTSLFWENERWPFAEDHAALVRMVPGFMLDRLRVKLRSEGQRHDIIAAAFTGSRDLNLTRLLSRADAVRGFVESEAGANLLAAHRRAVNILRIEEKRDGHAFDTGYEGHLLKLQEEVALAAALEEASTRIRLDIEAEDFERAMEAMAGLRAPVDAFFEKVIVNDPAPELRRNRLRLLARLRAAMDAVADFSKIEA
ncbi:MAG: glycine--tRNA ligase subunit beta [Roseomonas sp.]|nr:glycine--tRNA ligase subunit beta [Roseomonas sp.]